jgi:tRNA-uridine 2-sulfurtransferase
MAMSGGVDSSVAAALLVEQGFDVVGVHMRLHGAVRGLSGGCCGMSEAVDAAKVADVLGIPFCVLDLRADFSTAVVSTFVRTYQAGRTPSPCIPCNRVLKFRVLLARAQTIGARFVATGHYARRAGQPPFLHSARDTAKDQSYFLFSLDPTCLSSVLLPLGDLSKTDVRRIAGRLRLPVAQKQESQEICFIPDNDHASFIRDHLEEEGESFDPSGPIVDEAGQELGRHDAYYRFTVGQRRGLGVALGQPCYVVAIHPESATVVVGPESSLYRSSFEIDGESWFQRPKPGVPVLVRLRHRAALVAGKVIDGLSTSIVLDTPARAITPGQAAVVYEMPVGDQEPEEGYKLLGGGWISRVLEP